MFEKACTCVIYKLLFVGMYKFISIYTDTCMHVCIDVKLCLCTAAMYVLCRYRNTIVLMILYARIVGPPSPHPIREVVRVGSVHACYSLASCFVGLYIYTGVHVPCAPF